MFLSVFFMINPMLFSNSNDAYCLTNTHKNKSQVVNWGNVLWWSQQHRGNEKVKLVENSIMHSIMNIDNIILYYVI